MTQASVPLTPERRDELIGEVLHKVTRNLIVALAIKREDLQRAGLSEDQVKEVLMTSMRLVPGYIQGQSEDKHLTIEGGELVEGA